MDAIFEPAWRVYPASLLIAAGALVLAATIHRSRQYVAASATDAQKPIALASSLRLLILALSLAGLGIRWIGQWVWVVVFSAIFLGEEMLETSIVVSALKDGERLKARARHRAAPATTTTDPAPRPP
jgi:hypothetical protein